MADFTPAERYTVQATDRLACAERKEVCEVYDPFCRNCITVSDVLACIEYLINNWDEYPLTFLNIAGRDLVSREDIVRQLIDRLGLKLEYKVIYPGDGFYSCRPKVTRMESRYLNSPQPSSSADSCSSSGMEFMKKVRVTITL